MTHVSAADDRLLSTFGRLVEVHSRLSQRLGRSLERDCEIPLGWFEVLLRVSRAEHGRVTMGALAHEVALTTGGITRLLDRMVRAGLLARVPSPTDRRVLFAELTDDGRDKLAAAAAAHAKNLGMAFADFAPDDLDDLDMLLDRLRDVRLD